MVSSPAVILYNSVFALQAIAWILLTGAALKESPHPGRDVDDCDADEQQERIFRVRDLFDTGDRSDLVSADRGRGDHDALGAPLVHGINIFKPSGQREA